MIKFQKVLVTLILAVGLIIAGVGINRILEARKCKDWEIIKGRVLSSMIKENSDIPYSESKIDNFHPDITYEYRYKGTVYFKQTIGYIPSKDPAIHTAYYSGSESEIKDFLKKFPANSVIDVYVNPEDPEESVLETDLKMPVFIPLLFGFLLMLLALHLLFFGDKYLHLNKEETKEG
jgi:hypothetical protein